MSEENKNTQQNSDQPLRKRKFEIAVYDEDLQENGSIRLKPIPMTEPLYIEAATKAEFNEIIRTYKECGQQIKIIREIDPPPRENYVQQQSQVQNSQQNQQEQLQKRKPIVFKVGDIEIKEDNGTVYQKQWVRLTDKEAKNFRLVNTDNNKLVSLKGKHIEMKRWIKVENSEDDTSIESEIQQ